MSESGAVAERDFLDVMAEVCTPVTVVTGLEAGAAHGTTVSSFSQTCRLPKVPASSSLVPPQLPHLTTPRHGKYYKLLRDLLSVSPLSFSRIQNPHVQPCFPFSVRSNKSQSYEPLLLENEREAVADLLQFLESTRDPCPEYRSLMLTVNSRSHEHQLLLGPPADRVDNTLVFRQR